MQMFIPEQRTELHINADFLDWTVVCSVVACLAFDIVDFIFC
jgi:hypothetical protein